MGQEIDGSSKLTVSLTWQQWLGVICGIAAVTGYVVRNELAVTRNGESYANVEASFAKAEARAQAADRAQDSTIANHGWRLNRAEQRLEPERSDRPEYDDEGYIGPEPFLRRKHRH